MEGSGSVSDSTFLTVSKFLADPVPTVTGASSGFGRLMTELVLRKGEIAVATLRKPEAIADLSLQYGPDRLLVTKLDVTDGQEIKNAFAGAVEHFGRVDVVFNNAGYALFGEAEGMPDELARAAMEVDFWAAANVSRETLRVFREVNKPAGGFLLQVSSASALVGLPGLAYYCAPKHGQLDHCAVFTDDC